MFASLNIIDDSNGLHHCFLHLNFQVLGKLTCPILYWKFISYSSVSVKNMSFSHVQQVNESKLLFITEYFFCFRSLCIQTRRMKPREHVCEDCLCLFDWGNKFVYPSEVFTFWWYSGMQKYSYIFMLQQRSKWVGFISVRLGDFDCFTWPMFQFETALLLYNMD